MVGTISSFGHQHLFFFSIPFIVLALLFFFFFFILWRMGKNKAVAHHTSTYFHTRRVSI